MDIKLYEFIKMNIFDYIINYNYKIMIIGII